MHVQELQNREPHEGIARALSSPLATSRSAHNVWESQSDNGINSTSAGLCHSYLVGILSRLLNWTIVLAMDYFLVILNKDGMPRLSSL